MDRVVEFQDLTKEDYLIAESNGISRRCAYQRVKDYFWDKKLAITLPMGSRPYRKHCFVHVARENGIKDCTFRDRLKNGWSPEKAATTPVLKKRYSYKKWEEECKKNGITKNAFNLRVNQLGWTEEKAATTPMLVRTKK